MQIEGKVCLVTGGTSGIGRALVIEFLKQKAIVVTCGRTEAKLQELAAECNTPTLHVFRADVSKETDCSAFIAYAKQQTGRIDVLVNNAGMSMRALFGQLKSVEILRQLMEVNFWGMVYCTHYGFGELLKNKGVVVGVSSIAGYRGLPARTGYSASKFAMQGFLEALRTENLNTGLHVMWASPGFTASNIRKTALDNKGKSQSQTPLNEQKLMSAEEVAARIIKGISKRKRTVTMTSLGKLTIWMNKLFPALTDKLVYNNLRKEPGSPLK